MAARLAILAIGVLCVAGCIDSTRVNATCTWSDSVARPLDLSRSEDRDHLRVDAQAANELMVRYGDVRYRNRPDMARPFRESCMSKLVDTLLASHAVTRRQIHDAERARIWWVDIVLVFAPIGLVTAIAMDLVTRRVCGSFESDDRLIATASIVLLTPVVAVLGLGVANFWAFSVEGWRLGNGHVSNRGSLIPIVVHGWIAYFIAFALCAAVAAFRLSRTPLSAAPGRYGFSRRHARV
jgi:outer membrane murein-binding lipoprotein Lpp